MPYGFLRGNKNARYVDRERPIAIECDFSDRPSKGDTGIVDQNIEAAELIDRLRDSGAYGIRICSISRDGQRAPPGCSIATVTS